MKHDLLLLYRFFRIAVCNLTHYRTNFVFVIIYWLVSLSVLVVFWRVLFQFLPPTIDDWDFPRLCILNSMVYISWGFFVFFWGLHQIPRKVISGGLDKFLARPISPLVGIIGEEIHLEAIYEITTGFVGLFIFSYYYSLAPSVFMMIFALITLFCGTLVIVLLHGVISLSSFWIGKIDSLQQMADAMDDFQKYPLSFYPKNFRWVLMFLVPLYFPGSFAARVYLGLPIPYTHWIAFFVAILIWGGFFTLLYSKCLKHYEANG